MSDHVYQELHPGWIREGVVPHPPNQTFGVHGPEAKMHLISNESYEESEVWCGDIRETNWRHGYTHDPAEVGCEKCLRALRVYALKGEKRLLELLYPNPVVRDTMELPEVDE